MSNRSRFASIFHAVEYAYGIAPGIPPLMVTAGPNASGAQTLNVATQNTALTDGTNLIPLNASNTPIQLISGASTETVTPSAVSNSPVNGQTTVTATFANAQGAGVQICSGTVGLQESINIAAAAGGGTVIVDQTWALYGGTSAMLATALATIPNTVTLLDNRTGTGGLLNYAYGTLSNATVKTLFSVGAAAIPAAGTGTLIEVDSLILENINGGTAYTGGGAIQLGYGATATLSLATPASSTVAATFLTSPTVSQVIRVQGALASSTAALTLNTPVRFVAATADFATGTGTIKYKIAYRVVTGL
jgi:hypothetical protein